MSRGPRTWLAGAAGAAAAAALGLAAAGPGDSRDPALPQVVAVRVQGPVGPPQAATGTVVGPGRVLTVAHAVAEPGRVAVGGAHGNARRAAVLRTDADVDLAVLRVPGVQGAAPRVEDPGSGAADAGSRVRILLVREGRTVPRAATVRRRITARLVDEAGRPRRPALELAADVRAGDSGAPVVGPDGRLVGIVFARSSRRDGTAYAVTGPALGRLTATTR